MNSAIHALQSWLFPARFVPHGHCYLWQTDLVRLHLVSDGLIAIAYYSIPLMLIYFVRQRTDVPFRNIFWLFSAFIITCGTTHLMSIWTLWYPAYWVSGAVKATTAFFSVYTALALVPILPEALSLPSPEKLRQINQNLAKEVEERKRAEAELQALNQELELRVETRSKELLKSEERWQSLIDSLQLMVVGLDDEGSVTYVNPHFSSVTGYRREEILGQSWFDTMLPRQSQAEIREVFEQGLAKPVAMPLHYENTILTATGEERIIAWNNTVLMDAQEPSDTQTDALSNTQLPNTQLLNIQLPNTQLQSQPNPQAGIQANTQSQLKTLSIGEDITQRSAIQRMKDEFISVVSHELRTPLTSIHGALDLLNSGLVEAGSERSRQVLDVAAQNSDHLVQLVDDILELERLESGKIRLELAPTSTRSITQAAVNVMAVLAEQAAIQLQVSDPGLEVWADGDRIAQVLTNLIDNAIKFSEPGSTIQIKVEPALDAQAQPGENHSVCFQVIDSGTGIPPEQLNTIFDRFYQVDPSDSRNPGGTGLGLAICRSIVSQHQGQIWVESTLGQGCHFYFTLPLDAADDRSCP